MEDGNDCTVWRKVILHYVSLVHAISILANHSEQHLPSTFS